MFDLVFIFKARSVRRLEAIIMCPFEVLVERKLVLSQFFYNGRFNIIVIWFIGILESAYVFIAFDYTFYI